jgi:HTH-type transcriptional regulator/antitoxin HigA
MPKQFKTVQMKILKTKKDYTLALKRLEKIFDAKAGTAQGDELDLLGLLIEKYESEHFPVDFPDPIEAIKFRMEQIGYSQQDLAKIIGFKGRVSEVLNKKRKLSLDMIRKINHSMHIPTDVLIKEY